MTIESLIWLIPLPPLLAFILIILLTNRSKSLSHALAIGAACLAWIGSMLVFWQAVHAGDLGSHPFCFIGQLASQRQHMAVDRRGLSIPFSHHPVFCRLDGAGHFRLQHRLP